MNELIVGIDLGTTNSELAVIRDGKVEVLPIHGKPIMPSCVGIDTTGALVVGQTAKNQMVATPESTILSIKRLMGDDTRVRLGDKEFSPEEISSFILRELKIEGERLLGQPIRKAVITVPAFFNERQRKATQVAGELAGLDVVRIINEPTAAALAYGAGKSRDERLLVYDLGGGTFDVSVVVVEQGVVEVKASHGNTHLGGDDFDQLLLDRAAAEFEKQHHVDIRGSAQLQRRLKVVMERAKCQLSDTPVVRIREEYIDGQHHLDFEITRAEYEDMILPQLEKTIECVHQSLTDARLTPSDIDKVMLVGGATRTPLVQELLKHRMQLDPRFEIDPDLIVAMGAAIQGGTIAGQTQHAILIDITPHTFSIDCLSNHQGFSDVVCQAIIPRNTPLPARKAELFQTHTDNQPIVDFGAYQGEGLYPEENTEIGRIRVEGLSAVPAGNPFIVQFELDLNGMLKVTATEKNTGLAKTTTLDTRAQHVIDMAAAKRNISSLTGDLAAEPTTAATDAEPIPAADASSAPHALMAAAKDLRKRGETLLATSISPDDATEIRNIVHASTEAIKTRDWTALAQHNDTLSDLLFYLED
jgi:molecular chaperone DnaK